MERKEMDDRQSTAPRRMWINQPSTLQPLHHLHAVRVLAAPDTDACARAYFLSGDTISMQVPHDALSEGWPASSRADHDGAVAPRSDRAR
jgi:hypothetical protein